MAQPVPHCWSVSSKVALPGSVLEFSRLSLPVIVTVLVSSELVVLVTGFRSLPWRQRHVGQGAEEVGE